MPFETEEFQIGTARDFQFVMTDFHFEVGLTVTLISSDGSIEHVFPHPPGMDTSHHRAMLEVDPTDLQALRSLLIEIDFPELARGYHRRDIDDGTTAHYALRASGKSKVITCYAYSPDEIQRVKSAVRALLERREPAVQAAPSMTSEEYDAFLTRVRAAGISEI